MKVIRLLGLQGNRRLARFQFADCENIAKWLRLTLVKYLFLHGRNPQLSAAELGALLGSTLERQGEGFFFEGALPSLPNEFLRRLGGMLEILEICAEAVAPGALLDEVLLLLRDEAATRSGKFQFGVTVRPDSGTTGLLKKLLPSLKKNLREHGISSIFLNKNFCNLNRVFALKQKLPQRGASIHLLQKDGLYTVALARAIQDVDAYSQRDYGKPFRDAAVGMLPPKLAQILINLASPGTNPPSLIIDPLCGSGTILMEALLMGYSVIGSDKDARLVEGAKKNVEWLQKLYPQTRSLGVHIAQQDACAANSQPLPSNSVIVTEPYLGPPLLKFPDAPRLVRIQKELTELYIAFFKALATKAKKGTPVVIIFPVWRDGHKAVRLASVVVAKLEALGYSSSAFAPLHTDSLLYDRPDQIVGREIIRFVRN